MKKFAYIALTMMLVFAACTKVETYPEAESRISFAVGSYMRQTKAESSFLGEFANAADAQFKSKAYMHGAGVSGTQDFFGTAGETITWNSTSAEWAPSHDYYWPKSSESYIDFVSWYDKKVVDPTLGYSYDEEGTKLASATMSWTDRTIVADDNILVADVAWRQQSNAQTYLKDGVTAGVPTLFRHYLSRVKVNVRSRYETDPSNANVTYEVILQNAKIEGLHHQGSLSLTNADDGTTRTNPWTAASGTDYLWTAGGTASDVNLVSSNTTVTTTDLAILEQRAFLPQALSNDVKLVFTYTVTSKSNNTVTSSESNIPATIVLNTIKNASDVAINGWLPNKSYTYTIVIDPINKEILLKPVVANDWDFSPDINVTVE